MAVLNDKLNTLYEEKRRIKLDFKQASKKYKEQQNLCNMARLIAKRKQELINLRVKEENEKKMLIKRCEDLIETCNKLLMDNGKSTNEENPQNEVVSKEKKSKKKKQKEKLKKAKAIAITIELDRLRENFQGFGIAMPNKRADLELAIEGLTMKLKEIENKPLSKSIPVRSNDKEDSVDFSYDVNEEY